MLARVKSEEVNFSRIVISSELSCCEVNFITHSPNLLSFIFVINIHIFVYPDSQ